MALLHAGARMLGDLDAEEAYLLLDLLIELEPARHQRQRRPLDQQREQGDEEDDIEERLRPLDLAHQWIGGEDDGHGAAQAYPGEEVAPVHRDVGEEEQAEVHGQRTREEDHEDP